MNENFEESSSPRVTASTPAAMEYAKVLDRCMGDNDFLLTALQAFTEQAQRDLASIASCCASNDLQQLGHIAHALKSAAGYMAADSLRAASERLEKLSTTDARDAAQEAADGVRAEIQRCLAVIPSICQQARRVEEMKRRSPSPLGRGWG